MEVALLGFAFVVYLTIRYFLVDHDTPADKDRKRFRDGILLVEQRRYQEGYTYFSDVLTTHTRSAVAYAYRGHCQLEMANLHSAVYDLTQALNLDNTLAGCYLYRGMAYYRLRQFEDAFREFDKAVWYHHNQNPDVYRWRALARVEIGQQQQAAYDLQKAIALGDENALYVLRQPPFSRSAMQRN